MSRVGYLLNLYRHSRGFGVHSPWAYTIIREVLPEHGWGRQILARIAEKHDGEVRVDRTNESWVTEVFLSLSER